MSAHSAEKRSQKVSSKQALQSVYSPLDPKRHEFRLLVLKPGSYSKPLHGILKRVRFPDAGKPKGAANFETVSYVWGNQSLRDTITVNAQPLDIPASAASALRCMRFRHGERSLWIDSICINQEDLQERAQQVSMMAEIYFCAFANLVHLGDDDEKAENAFDSIERIVQEIEDEADGVSLDDLIFYDNKLVKRSTSPLTYEPDFDALTWLFNRPWFSRLWVVQELLLSSRSIAYCGNLSIAMTKILTATGWLQHKLLHLPRSIGCEGFWGASNMFMMQDSGHDLTDLLMKLGLFNCSDIRDKVFGGLGLYQSRNKTVKGFYGMPDALTPDYTKNAAHVLRDATRLCIDDDRSLYLLARTHYEHRGRPKALPTWIPDWYRKPGPEEPPAYLPQLFDASGDLRQPEILQHPNPDILSLRGVFVSSISQLTPTTTMDTVEDVCALTGQLQRTREMTSSMQLNESALAMTLIAGELRDEQETDGDLALPAWQAFLAYIELNAELPPSSDTDSGDMPLKIQAAVEFQYSLRKCMMWRRFFTTAAGQIGTGPKELKNGDLLVVLPGSTVPFALRKKGENYTMVGQVYVHGAMHGEVLEKDFGPSPQWMTFNIE